MTDSPAFRAPLDPTEQPILDKLLLIRDKLLLHKQDKTKYVKSQDVMNFYDQVVEQVEELNKIRTYKCEKQNRLDTVLDDCFQLISLFFMTIGRNNEAPAAYSLVSTIKRLLDHLKEAGFFAGKDLDGIARRLEIIEECVDRCRSHHNPHMLTLLETRIACCRAVLTDLRNLLSQMSPELLQTHEKLVSILRCLSGSNAKSKFPASEVKELRRQLEEIEANFHGGSRMQDASEELSPDERLDRYASKLRKMSYEDAGNIPGRDVVADLLERCFLWSDIVLQRQGRLEERFKDTYDTLLGVRNQLEKLSLTQAWSLRETDLYGYQRKLDRVDEARVDGNFLDANGQPAELYEQRTLLYLLRKSYSLIYFMLTSSEPVSEALLPIYNQLTTLRKCLKEVRKSGGVSSARELYPYSMKLNSIDNMRHDGKFIVNGDIPEGQGSVIDLLSECFDMAYELRTEAEQEEEAEDQREDDNDGKDDDRNGATGGAKENGDKEDDADEGEEEEEESMTMKKVQSIVHPPPHAATATSVGVK